MRRWSDLTGDHRAPVHVIGDYLEDDGNAVVPAQFSFGSNLNSFLVRYLHFETVHGFRVYMYMHVCIDRRLCTALEETISIAVVV